MHSSRLQEKKVCGGWVGDFGEAMTKVLQELCLLPTSELLEHLVRLFLYGFLGSCDEVSWLMRRVSGAYGARLLTFSHCAFCFVGNREGEANEWLGISALSRPELCHDCQLLWKCGQQRDVAYPVPKTHQPCLV